MEQLVASLILWISLHSGYPVDEAAPPAVTVLSAPQFRERLQAQPRSDRSSDSELGHVHGMFDGSSGTQGTIYMLDPKEHEGADNFRDPLENPAFRAHLVHQLVHYAQWQLRAHRKWRCNAYGEFAADAIEWNYLFSQGIKAPMPRLQAWIRLADSC